MLTVGSLFSGIGGFDLGFERAGMRVAWQCEANEFCRRVLAQHWPNVPCYADVREINSSNLAAVDVLCGGFPCQDISSAGYRVGIEGARSSLWAEFARLIGELRPQYVVVENVAALLIRGLGRVLGDLAALGYDAEWDCIPAAAIGAPHIRDRVWIVAYPHGDGWEAHANDALLRLQAEDPWLARYDGTAIRASLLRDVSFGGPMPSLADDMGMADGIPDRVDRLSALGNALLPQIAEWLGRRILEWEQVAA